MAEGDLTLGDEHMMCQNTDDVLWNCTLETNMVLLTNVTATNFIKIVREIAEDKIPKNWTKEVKQPYIENFWTLMKEIEDTNGKIILNFV